jgi:hypothetical protein
MVVELDTLVIVALIFFICGMIAGVSLTRPRIGS